MGGKLKNKLLKKLFSIILTTIFLFGFNTIPANAVADGNYNCSTGTFTIASNVLTRGNACTGVLTIPLDVTAINTFAFSNLRITTVTIPNSVTSIGLYAFSQTRLTSVVIPDSVTSLGTSAFDDIFTLSSVTISNSLGSIPAFAFFKSAITSLTIPNSVTSIGNGAFRDNLSLTSVTIGNSVTTIDRAFDGNTLLASVTFLGNAPGTVNANAFSGIAAGAIANVAYNATGFPADGLTWNGLIVSYGDAPAGDSGDSGDSGSSTPTVITPVFEEVPDVEFNSKNRKYLSKREIKIKLDKSKTFQNYPIDKYKYSIFGTSKKICAIKGNYVVELKDTGACEMWVTRTTAKGKKYKYWLKVNYI
jgi:hypothetical protein